MQMFKNTAKIVGTAVAASFTAMGAAALFFGKSAVTAAIEDDKAQKKLAKTIKNNTKVNAAYQHSIEKSVEALQNQFNIADDQLRPAFGKLITATKSVSKSQKIMRVALDVSAGTGKSLDTVVSALSRAYLGNNTALGKLGVGIDKTKLKGMSFDQLLKTLSGTMGGQAKEAANSYAGSVDGLKIAWSEFQESVGYMILPKLKGILEYIKNDLVPWLGELKDGFTGAKQETISPQLRKVSKAMGLNPDNPKSSAYGLGEAIKTMTISFGDLFKQMAGSDASKSTSTLEDLAISLTKIANAISAVTDAVGKAGHWYNNIGKLGQWYPRLIVKLSGNNPDEETSTSTKASGGPVRRGRSYLVGENGPEMFVPSGAGGIRTASQTRGMGYGSTVINLNGIVDAESARRTIEKLMRESSLRSGTVNLNGSIF